MTEVVRLQRHPTDNACALLVAHPDLNQRLGKFGPARFVAEHHGYVLHHDHVDALYRFAKTAGIHVVDERVASSTSKRVPPHECRHCAQPARRFQPPAVCPSCGEPWTPTEPPVRDNPITRHPCPSCGHKQPGRFPFCSRCAAPMQYPQPDRRTTLPRTKLADPMPLATVLDQAMTEGWANPTTTRPKPPSLPSHMPGTYRRIDDVDLPDQEDTPLPDPTIEPDWNPQTSNDEPDPTQPAEAEVEDPPYSPWDPWAQ